MNETGFKQNFRDSIEKHTDGFIWTVNDMFSVGNPDLMISQKGRFFGVEAKYAKKLPARDGSLLSSAAPLSVKQRLFLARIHNTGNYGLILMGFEGDIFIAIPIYAWPMGESHIRVNQALQLKQEGFYFELSKMERFFETIRVKYDHKQILL